MQSWDQGSLNPQPVSLTQALHAGHLEVARTLLQAGASCNEYTFDGERCHYVSLYRAIRDLLSMYAPEVPLHGVLICIHVGSTCCAATEKADGAEKGWPSQPAKPCCALGAGSCAS